MSYQLISVLNFMHERSVVHRDIKPENLLLTSPDAWDIKVTDFGLIKIFDEPHFAEREAKVLRIRVSSARRPLGSTLSQPSRHTIPKRATTQHSPPTAHHATAHQVILTTHHSHVAPSGARGHGVRGALRNRNRCRPRTRKASHRLRLQHLYGE